MEKQKGKRKGKVTSCFFTQVERCLLSWFKCICFHLFFYLFSFWDFFSFLSVLFLFFFFFDFQVKSKCGRVMDIKLLGEVDLFLNHLQQMCQMHTHQHTMQTLSNTHIHTYKVDTCVTSTHFGRVKSFFFFVLLFTFLSSPAGLLFFFVNLLSCNYEIDLLDTHTYTDTQGNK